MRVLGIDPAAAGPTGYAVLETDGRSVRMLECGALRHARAASAAERLRAVHARMCELIEEHAPDEVAVEAVFTALNMKTAIRLAEVRGVVLLAAAERDLPVHSYAPREVKASVAGYGHADKHQVQQMVRALLGLRHAPDSSALGTDATDAAAVALCHIQTVQARRRFAQATGAELPRNSGARGGQRRSSRSRAPRIQIER